MKFNEMIYLKYWKENKEKPLCLDFHSQQKQPLEEELNASIFAQEWKLRELASSEPPPPEGYLLSQREPWICKNKRNQK